MGESLGYETLLADTEMIGAKVAIVCGERILTYVRDNHAHIPDPDCWDLPGGLREPNETIRDCALREVWEEFGLRLPRAAFVHAARFTKYEPRRIEAVFLAIQVEQEMVDRIVFGDEGQCWELMPVSRFIAHPRAVKELQACVAVWWEGLDG